MGGYRESWGRLVPALPLERPLLRSRENHRLLIGEDFLPRGHSSQGEDQRRIGREHYRPDSPLVQRILPGLAFQIVGGGELVHKSVSVEVGAAVYVDLVGGE